MVSDDMIVSGSLCVGPDCADGEVFDFDSIKLKGPEPQINFVDTSVTASFPTNDWRMGSSNDAETGTALFFVDDVTSGARVLQLQSGETGGVALGARSALEAGAISVGSIGSERKIVHVAAGTDANDAVTLGQFNTFKVEAEQSMASDITRINTKLDELTATLESLATRVDQLTP
ncbi:hypothetical protein [Ferrimonas sediminum]|uniref:hypothetical protein n=1 Tax=Ferrimonas sediminum TaxID=718193 RepID=UPI002481E93E|nr:hypothetical protein [Ferrimonas sediminum]